MTVSSPRRLPYLPAIDGLRAVAVIAVFLFHAGVVSGGFVGVDVFFVISGFLITSLILAEIEATGKLRLGAFWARRARRLLPALALVCAAVLTFSIIEGGLAVRRISRDVISALLYVANWAQITEGRDYFATYDAPPLLEHAWSLAIEEQFYLVWPLVMVGLLRAVRSRPQQLRRTVAGVAALAVVGSIAVSLWLRSDPGVALNRLYFGTDTRAVGLAIGCLAGSIRDLPARMLRSNPRMLDAAGLGGLAVLGVLTVSIDGSERWLYGPGFLAIAVASLAVIGAALGTTRIRQVLSIRPLVVLGTVSYGAYLWHLPVILILTTERTGLAGIALGSTWLAVTAALTLLSWLLVEKRALLPTFDRPLPGVAYGSVITLLVLTAVLTSIVTDRRDENAADAIPAPAPAPALAVTDTTIVPTLTGRATSGAPDEPVGPSNTESTGEPAVESTDESTARRPMPSDRPLRVLIIGDSVAESLSNATDQTLDVDGYGSVAVRNVAEIACPVIEEGEWWLLDDSTLIDPPSCLGANRFQGAVDDFEPDVVFMLFGWPGVGGGQRLDDGSIVQPCEAAFDTRWLEGYERAAVRLQRSSIVVISTVAPPAIPTRDQGDGTACLNDLIDQITVPTFDYAAWLCPDNDCTPSAGLRSDGIHFRNNDRLQRDVMNAVLTQVLPIAGF